MDGQYLTVPSAFHISGERCQSNKTGVSFCWGDWKRDEWIGGYSPDADYFFSQRRDEKNLEFEAEKQLSTIFMQYFDRE